MLLPSKFKFAPNWFLPQCPCCGDDNTIFSDFNTINEGRMKEMLGRFSTTILQQHILSAPSDPWAIHSISWDGTNTPIVDAGTTGPKHDKLHLMSGQFTSTIKDSQDTLPAAIRSPLGITWDGTDTPYAFIRNSPSEGLLILQSGQFTSTIKVSTDVSSISAFPHGVSYGSGTQTPWCAVDTDKLYLVSGQFSTTLVDSLDVSGLGVNNPPFSVQFGQPSDITWDGKNTLWSGFLSQAFFEMSGQFTSTVVTSEKNAAFGLLTGINTNLRTTG